MNSQKKQPPQNIILSLDANVLLNLQETGHLDVLPLIASLPNISIEIIDLVADIELGNRVYNRETGRTEAINNKEVDGYLLKILNNAKRLDFTPEFQQLIDGETSTIELVDGSVTKTINHMLASGEAYADPILPRNKNAPDITIVSTVAGYEVNQDILHGEMDVALIRTDYKSQGEVAIMEREKACQKSDTLRIVVSDDGISKPHPDYVERLDNKQSVNIATTAGLMRLMEWAYKPEIDLLFPSDKQISSQEMIDRLPESLQVTKDLTYIKFPHHVSVKETEGKAFHPLRDGLKQLKNYQHKSGQLQEWHEAHQKSEKVIVPESVEKNDIVIEKQGYSIELESTQGIPNIGKVLKQQKLFSREELAATLKISPDNHVLNELYEMFELLAVDNPTSIEPQKLGSSQSEIHISVCLNKQGKPEIYIDNIGAMYQELYENEKSGVYFDEKIQSRLNDLADPEKHKSRKIHTTIAKPETLEVVAIDAKAHAKEKTGVSR